MLRPDPIHHEDDKEKLAELVHAEREMGLMRQQIRAARRMSARQQDEELERLSARFDDPARPTFVWQLDFAEVFHRFGVTPSGGFNLEEPKHARALKPAPAEAGTLNHAGFDIVLANPPYVRQERIKGQKPRLSVAYECFDGRADLYVYFYERGMKLLRTSGLLCYISSNKFFRAGYGEGLRQFLREKTRLRRLIDFGDLPIFEATAYPCIVVAAHNEAPPDSVVATLNVGTEEELSQFTELAATRTVLLKQTEFGKGVWHLESRLILGLLAKLRKTGAPLGKVVEGKIYAGIKTGLNEAFIINSQIRRALVADDSKSKEIIKPFIKGKDIGRWVAETENRFIIYTPHGTDINNYPGVKRHLSAFKSDLEKRALDQKWFELQQPQLAFTKEFEKTKIVYPNVALGCRFALDSGCYLDMTAFCICSSDLALLGMLNSRVMSFFFAHLGIQRRGGYQEFKTQYVRELPIASTTAPERVALAALVKQVLDAKRADAAADTSALEGEIDQQVYALYGLTPEEIKIVEESSQR